MKNTTPKISIVIPTFNRAHFLMAALRAIQRQSLEEFEVIVVDNGPSQDGTIEQVPKLARDDGRIIYISTTERGVYFAYNIGCQRAKADLILTTDDDWEMTDPNTLAYIVRCCEEDQRMGVLGISEYYPDGRGKGQPVPCDVPRNWKWMLKDTQLYYPGKINRWGMIGTKFYYLPMSQKHKVDHVRASCMAFRRQVAQQEFGFFPLCYQLAGDGYRGETELCRRFARAGYDVVYSTEIQGFHKIAPRDPNAPIHTREQTPEHLYTTGCNNTLFFLRNYWTRPTSIIFLLWDMLVGNSTQPGLIRFFTTHKYLRTRRHILASLLGKWRGFIYYHTKYGDSRT